MRAAPAARSLTHCQSAGNERTTPLRRILGLSRLYLPCGRRRWRDVEDAVPYRAGACLTRCAHTATHKRTSRETRSDHRPRRTANPIQNAAQGRRFHHFPRRDPHPVNSAARGPASPQPVGVGVLDDPSRCSPPAPRRRRGCGRRGGARKGGTPGEGSPFNPLLRFVSKREFRALRRASKGSAPGPRPLFCKKAGQKTFKRQSTSDPNPSPWRRVIQSVREADTLAAEWQLPREWERRAGPETSRGRHHPISVFLWGSTPFLWARPKKWGGTGSTNVKPTASKTASSANLTRPPPP